MEQELQPVLKQFLDYTWQSASTEKADQPFLLGTLGLVASGKTTTATLISQKVPGSVLVRGNSARYLLQNAGDSFAKTRELEYEAARYFLKQGYAVLFDGDFISSTRRDQVQQIADEYRVPFYLIRIKPDVELARKRLEQRWNDIEHGVLKQSIDDFTAVTRDQKHKFEERVDWHQNLDLQQIPQLIGEIDNRESLETLEKQVDKIVKIILEQS